MPVKIEFQVIASTGEDENYRASELNYHGPTVRGWRSSANSSFPQEIILQLKVLAILQQIQILAHQYLIPQKIEICTSSKLDYESLYNNSRDLFEYLGFITFSDNKATGFRSRELKSILIPSKKAKYIKLRIHNNHINVKNVYNQVSLMAVNILGNELQIKAEDVEKNNNISHHLGAAHTYDSSYLSPYDDLAFQMSVDEGTARIIKIIENKMLQAVFENRLEHANALKITIENLRAAGEILGIYEQEKRKAIILEDFDRAKSKKIQIDSFRKRLYSTLRIDKLLDQSDLIGGYDFNSNAEENLELNLIRNSPRRSQINGKAETPNDINENVQNFYYEEKHKKSPSRLLCPSKQYPSQLIHSQSQTFQNSSLFYPTPTFSTSVSNPHLYQYSKQAHLTIPENQPEPQYKLGDAFEHVRTSSSISDSLTEDESPIPKSPEKYSTKPKPVQKWNGSLIPRWDHKVVSKSSRSPPPEGWREKSKFKTSHSEQKARSKTVTTNIVKSSFEAYEDRMLPALQSYNGNEVVRECQLAVDQQRKSTLNEREKKQAVLPIAVFGVEMIEKFYSKNFNDREEGLKQLQQELKKIANVDENIEAKVPSYNKVARAAIFLLHRGLRDTVYSVYKLAAETVRLFFGEFVSQRVSSAEVARSVEKLLPELLTKSGDVTPRIHNLAAHTILSMADCDEVRRLNIIPTHLSRPLTSSVHPRLALSRLEMVEQLILNHGISKDKKSGLTSRTLAEFGSSGLHHPAEAVRKVSERILIHVYKVNSRIVRKQLPPDDNITRRNLLYRQLFQEFDFMDVQRKLNEQNLEESVTSFETHSQVLPSQQPHVQTNHKINHNECLSVNEEIKNKSVIKIGLNIPVEAPFRLFNERSHGDRAPPRWLVSEQNSKPFKQRSTESSPRKPEEKSIKTLKNEDVKFPSLTDSIRTTKTRTSANQNRTLNPTKNPSLSNSLKKKESRRDTLTSSIPIYTSSVKKISTNSSQKEEKQDYTTKLPKPQEGRLKQATSKTIKVKMFELTKPETIENTPKSGLKENGKGTTETEESIKFSDSMLASIRENEFSMSGLFNGRDDAEKLNTCIFCLSKKKWTNEDSLNKHYLKNCLMLTSCEYCTEITEISGLSNHLLDDCKWKHIFQKCENCQEAILQDLYEKHECSATTGKVYKSRCPFCHKTIGDGESSWRRHLMGKNTCPNHPRQK